MLSSLRWRVNGPVSRNNGAMEPADFYTDLVAELYEPLRGSTPDPDVYAALVERFGQPALELGCGGGDPLIALRLRGLDVEGVDSSADMLERCRAAAAAAGVDVVLHHQRMEDLDLEETYPFIFLAGPTFNLLPDDDTALHALRAIRAHLEPGGIAFVPLFEPEAAALGTLGVARTGRDDGGAPISVTFVDQERDAESRIQRSTLRYERRRQGGEPEVLDRVWTLHWYSQRRFRDLAAEAGLEVEAVLDQTGRPAVPEEMDVSFVLRAADEPGV